MSPPALRTRWLGSWAVLSAAICGCHGGDVGKPIVSIQVGTATWGEATEILDLDRTELLVVFPHLPTPVTTTQTLEFRNRGSDEITLVSVEHKSGNSEFSLVLPAPLRLVPGAPPVSLPVHFAPTSRGVKRAEFAVTTDAPTLPTVSLEVSCIVGSLTVDVEPTMIDFGDVPVSTTATRTLTLTNHSGFSASITVGCLRGSDPLLFTSDPSCGASMTILDGESQSVTVQFSPLVATTATSDAYMSLSIPGVTGTPSLIFLQGHATSGVPPPVPGLTPDPMQLDFGSVALPATSPVLRSVTFTNLAARPIVLSADPVVLNLRADGSSGSAGPFQLQASSASAGTSIPPGGTLTVTAAFMPTYVNFLRGELDIASDDPQGPLLAFGLDGFGGGPAIQCSPSPLEFGPMAVGDGATRAIVCTNVGQNIPGYPWLALMLPDPAGSSAALTLFPANPAFQAAFDQPFPLTGLAAGQSTQIDVTYAPFTARLDQDQLQISTNDPRNPMLTIPLSGTGQ